MALQKLRGVWQQDCPKIPDYGNGDERQLGADPYL